MKTSTVIMDEVHLQIKNPVPSLFPQVGDVYKSKFHGIKVIVTEVKKKRFTVNDGHKEWKMNRFAFVGQWIYVRSQK